MKLDRIEIENFRSIPKETIKMDPRCRILVGINEAGKSNILKAASLLSPSLDPKPQDIRENADEDEEPSKKSEVLFIFKLEESDLKKIFEEELKDSILAQDKFFKIITKGVKQLDILEFMRERNEVIYEANLKEKSKGFLYWNMDDKSYKIFDNLYTLKENTTRPIKILNRTIKEGEKILVNAKNYQGVPFEDLEKIDIDFLNDFIGEKYIAFLEKNLPECIYWDYDKDNLLPSQIKLEEFSKNPEICKPLKHMFELAGHKNITNAFLEAKEKSSTHGITNLLNRVAKINTNHFREVWKDYPKDYKNIEFSLTDNGPDIRISIKESIRHSLDRRSEGFKKFITFLLMISNRVKKGGISNALILFDEPENSLHISACESLRDELLKISKTNYMIYGTHSPFMFDLKNIPRHLIIKKENEKTIVNEPRESEIYDEEVLFRAINYSVFKNLKEKNIIFEGWRDKSLFRTALINPPNGYVHLKDKFEKIGLAHAIGVRSFKNILPILELADRECLILSDNDKEAKGHQKKFQDEKLYGDWKRYDEIFKEASEITAEDFIKKDFIKKIWGSLINYPNLGEIQDINLLNDSKGVLFCLRKLAKRNYSEEIIKKILENFKEKLYQELKPNNIEETYYRYLKEVSKIIVP